MLIGIDIGGTSAKLGLVDESGRILRRAQEPTGAELPAGELVERLAEQVQSLGEGVEVGKVGLMSDEGLRPKTGT